MKISNKSAYRAMAIGLVSLFFVGALPWRELRADANTHGEYDGYPLSVVYDQTATWDLNTQGEFVLTNVSESVVENWTLEIEFASDLDITSLWNGQDLRDENTTTNTLIIGNEVYNAFIAPGESISFGLEIVGTEFAPVAPTSVTLTNVVLGEVQPGEGIITSEEIVEETIPVEEGSAPTAIVEDENALFPYAIFAESDISFNGWKSTITGDIYSGGDYLYQGSELYIDGYVRTVGTIQPQGWTTSMTGSTENIESIPMPDWSSLILSKAELMDILTDDDISSQNEIIANGFYKTEGSVTINSSEFGGDVVIVAAGDITLNIGATSGDGRILLFSENGNITINGSQAVFNGILYAPNGNISLNAYDITVNGRIVANTFGYSGSLLNVTADDTDLQLYEELPAVNVSVWDISAAVGDRIGYTITVPEESSYEILYRLNGDNITVDIPEEETTGYYALTANDEGEYTLEAYVSLSYGEFVLDSATITVTGVEPTSIPTTEPTVTPTSTPAPTATPTPTALPTVTPTSVPEPTATATPTPSATPTNTPTATPSPIDGSLDSDEDGLPDLLELELGTNPNDSDSDGDGIEDAVEVMVGYDPTEIDSNRDGIFDGDEDYDNDGLSNFEEITNNTNPFDEDTDFDGLNDSDELLLYTDPNNPDSDGDLILDGDEALVGKDPLDPSDGAELIRQTVTNEINNPEDPAIIQVDITMDCAGYLDYMVYSEDLYNRDYYSTDLVGRIGSPIGLHSYEDFDTAEVVFHYDENALGDVSEDNLGVLWYDEESGFYVIQNQAIIDTENNTVSVELTHFSTYVLVDLEAWNSIEPVNYVVPEIERGVDYYIAFDISQHMTIEARRNAFSTFQSLVNNMEDGDRVIVFYFDTNYVIDDLYYAGDTTEMNAVLSRVYNNLMGASLGGDYGSLVLPFQIAEAIINQSIDDIGNVRELLIITNDTEQVHTTANLNEMLYCKAAGGFTADFLITESISNSQWTFAWQYAEETGSGYYKYPSCIAVNNSIANYRIVSGWNIDSDEDGLPDFIEEQGYMGTNKKVYYSDPMLRDTDGDGVLDGEEAGFYYSIDEVDGNYIIVYPINCSINNDRYLGYLKATDTPGVYFFIKSDGTLIDSDYDGVLDSQDFEDLTVNESINYILYYNDLAITGLFGPYEEYCFYFRRNHMEYQSVYLSTFENFMDFWCNMTHDQIIGNDHHTEFLTEIKYSQVDNLIILCHGHPSMPLWLFDDDNEGIYLSELRNLLVVTPCYIETVDLQMCFGGKQWAEEGGDSFASVLVASEHIGVVYATPSSYHFNPITSHNYVNEDSIYKYTVLEEYGLQYTWAYDLGSSLPIMYRE